MQKVSDSDIQRVLELSNTAATLLKANENACSTPVNNLIHALLEHAQGILSSSEPLPPGIAEAKAKTEAMNKVLSELNGDDPFSEASVEAMENVTVSISTDDLSKFINVLGLSGAIPFAPISIKLNPSGHRFNRSGFCGVVTYPKVGLHKQLR